MGVDETGESSGGLRGREIDRQPFASSEARGQHSEPEP